MLRSRNPSVHRGFWAALTVAMLALAGCTSSGAGGPSQEIFRGGTVYFAETPGLPYWIFPFTKNQYNTLNIDGFQYLMYRPLYWFGQITTSSPTFDEKLSLAYPPTSSDGGTAVVIRLKGWKFSNGQHVDAQSVVFWMNMLMAEPAHWADAAYGGSLASIVGSYSAPDGPGGDVVRIDFKQPYATQWLLYNELSQITPMPEAWDVTFLKRTPGSGRCGMVAASAMRGSATKKACESVWAFDSYSDGGPNGTNYGGQMSADPATYGSNSLWKVVDGPWQLQSYNEVTNQATFVPNPQYSGPQRPIISKLVEVLYPTDTAVLAALEKGGPETPDVAAIEPDDLPLKSSSVGEGYNLADLSGRFSIDLQPQWGIDYLVVNFNSTGGDGLVAALVRQLYIRQALQLLVNQPQLIKSTQSGYGQPDYGPILSLPPSPFISAKEAANPYPFDPRKARTLLRDHGWVIHPNGSDVCVRPGKGPGECGRGIRGHAALKLTLLYSSAVTWLTQLAVAETSAWASVGINVHPEPELDNSAACIVVPHCEPSPPPPWELAGLEGWAYSPDYLPTGEDLFLKGAVSNWGNYDDATMNRLIGDTLTSNEPRYLLAYDTYAAKQLPVIWEPTDNLVTPYEISKNLGGVSPINSLQTLTPEYWYWKTPNHS